MIELEKKSAGLQMRPTRRTILRAAGVGTGAALLGGSVLAQGISNRPITIIVPFGPGTAPDTLARRMGESFQQRWKQPFVIENRSGASGTVGTTTVARAQPDGHTLMISPSTLAMSPSLYRDLAYDPVKSFEPVSQLVTIGFGLLLHRSAGQDVASFVQKAKEQPGGLFYGSPGKGTPHHLAMELFKQRAGIDVTHFPATSFAGAYTELLAGRLSAMFTTITIAKALPTDGSVKLVGVASAARLPSVPDVPTFTELGFRGVEVVDWYAMFAPAGTPKPVVNQLNASANEILQAPDVKAWFDIQGMVPAGGTSDQLRSLVASDITRWGQVIRDAGIKPE